VRGDFYGTPENNSLHLLNRNFTRYPEDAEKVALCIKSGVVNITTFQVDGSSEGLRRMVDNCNTISTERNILTSSDVEELTLMFLSKPLLRNLDNLLGRQDWWYRTVGSQGRA
jgi:hypothetical protein